MSQPYVRPDVRAFLDMLIAMNGPDMTTLPIADARQAFRTMAAIAEAEPLPLAVIRDLACPGPAGDIAVRLYDARDAREAGPLVMFFHGGGFVIGDLESHHALCTHIAVTLDLPVLAVDYRLAPEHPFPAAPDDAEAATRWAASSPEVLGLTVTGLILTGDSAGGNLTLVTGQALRQNPAAAPVLVEAPIYPATGLLEGNQSYDLFADGYLLTKATMDWFMGCYAPPQGSARGFPGLGDVTGAAPTVIITASLDPLRDEGRAYAARLEAAGVRVMAMEADGNIHGFANLRKAIPSSEDDLARFLAAVRTMLDQPR